MNKKINAIVQARMGSTRLPGKVLLQIEGVPILEHIINRLYAVDDISTVIIATSTEKQDDPIEAWCDIKNVPCVRGSEDNVLDRFRQAALDYPADIYIRATGDNPMIDVQLIRNMLVFFENNYLTYTCYKGYPIGSGVEIFTKKALEESIKQATLPYELEHVTPYMYNKMQDRRVKYYTSPDKLSNIRMTVDTEEDFTFAKTVFSKLYTENPLFGIDEITELLSSDKKLLTINSMVHQKKLGE